MLVLSRHRDESIVIADNIVITVVEVRGDKVRLGIEAPKEIPVHRREVYDAIKREAARGKLPVASGQSATGSPSDGSEPISARRSLATDARADG
jgi:carbon storage regulator